MIDIFKKLISKNKSPVAMLGLNEFLPPTTDTEDFEIENLLDVYFANLWSRVNESKSLESLVSKFIAQDFKMSEKKLT